MIRKIVSGKGIFAKKAQPATEADQDRGTCGPSRLSGSGTDQPVDLSAAEASKGIAIAIAMMCMIYVFMAITVLCQRYILSGQPRSQTPCLCPDG